MRIWKMRYSVLDEVRNHGIPLSQVATSKSCAAKCFRLIKAVGIHALQCLKACRKVWGQLAYASSFWQGHFSLQRSPDFKCIPQSSVPGL